MLKVIQRFAKHCSYHLQGKYVLVGQFWKTYIGQAVGGEWDMTDLFDEVEMRTANQLPMSTRTTLNIRPGSSL
jgi:hypothetical protein